MDIAEFPSMPGLFGRRTKSASVSMNLGFGEVVIGQPIIHFSHSVIFEHSFFKTCSVLDPMFIAFNLLSTPKDMEALFYLFELRIGNRSGATETYNFILYNETTGEIIEEVDNVAIVNKGFNAAHMLVSVDKIKEGDTIYFITQKGKLGTDQNEPAFAEYGISYQVITNARNVVSWLQ
jgi:hypothetical protein